MRKLMENVDSLMGRLSGRILSKVLPETKASAACYCASPYSRAVKIGKLGNLCIYRVEKRHRECCDAVYPWLPPECQPTGDWYNTGEIISVGC